MERINEIIDKMLFHVLSAGLAALVGICFVQVLARYMLNASFSWAEEVSILLMVWATWGGACLAVKRGSHLRILILVDRVKPKNRLILHLALNCLTIPFLVVIAITSRTIISGMANMTLFSLPGVPMNVMYISVPVGCVLMIYYVLRSMVSDWKTFCAQTRKEG